MQILTHFPGNQLDDTNEQIDANRYEVYVNRDFIGEKKIYDRRESIFDLEEFLKEQGIIPSSSRLEGNHFHITEIDEAIEQQTKEALQLFLLS